MSNTDKFYSAEEELGKFARRKIWWKVRRDIRKPEKYSAFNLKSFVLGAATVLILFLVPAVISFLNDFSESRTYQGNGEVINTYSRAASFFEDSMEKKLSKNTGVEVDGKLVARKEQLNDINNALAEIKEKDDNLRAEKLERIIALYKMKIEIIDKIIMMELEK